MSEKEQKHYWTFDEFGKHIICKFCGFLKITYDFCSEYAKPLCKVNVAGAANA